MWHCGVLTGNRRVFRAEIGVAGRNGEGEATSVAFDAVPSEFASSTSSSRTVKSLNTSNIQSTS